MRYTVLPTLLILGCGTHTKDNIKVVYSDTEDKHSKTTFTPQKAIQEMVDFECQPKEKPLINEVQEAYEKKKKEFSGHPNYVQNYSIPDIHDFSTCPEGPTARAIRERGERTKIGDGSKVS